MKKLHVFHLIVVLLSAVILGGIVSSAFAQPAETNVLEWREIAIQNTTPHLIAYWMDPAHNPMPIEYQKASNDMNSYPMVKFKESQPKFSTNTSTRSNVLQKPDDATIFADDTDNVSGCDPTKATSIN